MEHEINRKLERLDPPVGPDEDVVIAIVGVHDKIGKGSDERSIHGFGMEFRLSSGRAVRPFSYLSRTEETTHQRGELGALLTSYQWLELNAGHARSRVIMSAEEYLTVHLPAHISEWVKESPADRPNHDLLLKILPFATSQQKPELRRPETKAEIAQRKEAKKAARAAVKSITLDRIDDLPGDQFDIFDDITPEDEVQMKRAIERDRS